jgi:thiol:disulfide interchange protein DsbD
MTRSLSPVALVILGLAAALAPAAPPGDPFSAGLTKPKKFTDLADVKLEVTPARAKRGEPVTVKLTAVPKNGGWTYPFNPTTGQASQNSWSPPKGGPLVFTKSVNNPPATPKPDNPNELYYKKPVVWEIPAVVSTEAKPGAATVTIGDSSLLACYDDERGAGCIPARRSELPTASFEVLDGPGAMFPPAPAVVQPPATREGPEPEVTTTPPPAPKAEAGLRKNPVPPEQYAAELNRAADIIDVADVGVTTTRKAGLLAFLITAATWGLVSLVTPCVFPMIPITISIFMKQGHQSRVQTVKLAAVYCLTIVVVLGVSAIALLKVFVDLSNSVWMNLFLGGLFVFFALSLFGMYDIALPNSLLQFTRTKQGAGGLVGTVFGALAFTIVSFTCVAPFLGGFAGMATSGGFSTFELVLGGLAFSAAFAAPFFLLALFPTLLKALPRSGGWLDSVKVVMGFLELAAALKFFRTAEFGLFSPPVYFTYDLVLGGWVAIAAACGLYLLNAYRLPHDEERPGIGVPRLVFALLFLGLAVYLTPALFKGFDGRPQRPTGVVYAWVDAFLLPDPASEFGTDLPAAMRQARAAGRPVFIDFTGVRCTNCRYNENNVFPKPQVWSQMEQYERVQLYTDEVPARVFTTPPSDDDRRREAEANGEFKFKVFEDVSLPQYVVLVPRANGRWVARAYPEGKINDPAAFAAFLQDGLKAGAK